MDEKEIIQDTKCATEGCEKEATTLTAEGNSGDPAWYCDEHAAEIYNSGEFLAICPNCKCHFPI